MTTDFIKQDKEEQKWDLGKAIKITKFQTAKSIFWKELTFLGAYTNFIEKIGVKGWNEKLEELKTNIQYCEEQLEKLK